MAMHALQQASGPAVCLQGTRGKGRHSVKEGCKVKRDGTSAFPHVKEMISPMLLTPGVVLQGEGGVPDVAPGSGIGEPVAFLIKHKPVASMKVKPAQ